MKLDETMKQIYWAIYLFNPFGTCSFELLREFQWITEDGTHSGETSIQHKSEILDNLNHKG